MIGNPVDIYNYLKPIVSGCSGFVKSSGLMLVQDNILLMMSYDRAFINIVDIQHTNLLFVAEISTFLGCKDTPETFMTQCAFYGSNIILNEMMEKCAMYYDLHNIPQEYYEDNIYNLPNFAEKLKTSIQWTVFSGNGQRYKLAVSKSIFPLNKGDECGVRIFNPYNDNTRLMCYEVHKKKLKVIARIITRQFVFTQKLN